MVSIKIAICDDSADERNKLTALVKHFDSTHSGGFSLDIFSDGTLLLEKYKSNSSAYDIVLLDVLMPGLDGISTAKEIRSSDNNVKIIF